MTKKDNVAIHEQGVPFRVQEITHYGVCHPNTCKPYQRRKLMKRMGMYFKQPFCQHLSPHGDLSRTLSSESFDVIDRDGKV